MFGMVPFLDLRDVYRELGAELEEASHRVLSSGRYLFGPELEAFENEFASYCGAAHCVGVGNGLDALTLILRALKIGRDDQVLVPGNTFIATWLAVSAVGAQPVGVEPDDRTYNIDPERVAAAIGPRTRALIAVHLYGQPADMDELRRIADRHGLALIEDAAQAHGACYRGRKAGALSTAAAFSFYPGKNLGAMDDAGAVVTDDQSLAAQVRRLRNYGSAAKYVHDCQGVNSRLGELQAAFLRIKLRRLDAWNARRRAVAARYHDGLRGIRDITLPFVPAWCDPSWHLYVIQTPARDRLQQALAARGVETLIHYPIPPHRSGAYRDLAHRPLPISERLAGQILSLPMGPHLTEDQLQYTVQAVRDALVQ